MALTPIDVQQKTFATAMRGYDLDEVDDFLDKVVISLKDYEQRLRDAQERIATLESELSQRSDQESAISRALVAAQHSADALVEDAREEAQRILADAESHASELEDERDAERRVLGEEIESIRAQVGRLRSGVASLLASVASGLDGVEEFVDAQAGESSDGSVTGVTFDAAEPDAGSSSDEPDTEEASYGEPDDAEPDDADEPDGRPAGQHVADQPVSNKIVIPGAEELDDDDAWDVADDEGYGPSASIDEITGRIDEVFGDVDDAERADDDSDDAEWDDDDPDDAEWGEDDGDEDGDAEEDTTPIRPWET